ncbi:MAG TPA: heavy metal translocating P-type ATPase [Devosia sp.]|nr:heavy metal translocating P-type ATPase [Devosia sp.]
MISLERLRERALVAIAVLGLAAGIVFWSTGRADGAAIAWSVATAPVLIALIAEIVIALSRRDIGLDVIAALSMSAALVFGEPLAANVVALMYAGGQLLEKFAEGRARREMTALLGRVAHTAMVERDGQLVDTAIGDIAPGDILYIRQGEVLPVDGHLAPGDVAVLDPAAITGESLPVHLRGGGSALSGATSASAPFRLIADRTAAESTYAGIVKLVEAAQQSKAPMTRLADRYAVGFLVLTLVLAIGAWLLSGDRERALAVLVSSTPCPLILAVPVALISGISRAAKEGVLVKDGGVFEALARVRVAILDKTGTLTHGRAEIVDVLTADGFGADDVLRYAASLDQASGHPIAATLIDAAGRTGLKLSAPNGVIEEPGLGIRGIVDDVAVAVGGDRYVAALTGDDPYRLHPPQSVTATVAVAIDNRLAGVIVLDDKLRSDAADLVADLRTAGAKRVILASGDRTSIAKSVGAAVGVDEVLGEASPSQKVDAVRRETALGPTMMIGDGVNDAPALVAADVGVAMGARGATASSQSAGVVMLVDELKPLIGAMTISRRSIRIALESVWIGLGLSVAAMVAAALGYLPPVQGALFQEAIDVAVILNALRALR